jgi:hypothetical protein
MSTSSNIDHGSRVIFLCFVIVHQWSLRRILSCNQRFLKLAPLGAIGRILSPRKNMTSWLSVLGLLGFSGCMFSLAIPLILFDLWLLSVCNTSVICAKALGKKAAMIERHYMGGDCLNVGCFPSKAIIRCARAIHEVCFMRRWFTRQLEIFDFLSGKFCNRYRLSNVALTLACDFLCVDQVKTAARFGVQLPAGAITIDFGFVMARMRELRAGIAPHDGMCTN